MSPFHLHLWTDFMHVMYTILDYSCLQFTKILLYKVEL